LIVLDGQHPSPEAHGVIGERFAERVLCPGRPFAPSVLAWTPNLDETTQHAASTRTHTACCVLSRGRGRTSACVAYWLPRSCGTPAACERERIEGRVMAGIGSGVHR